LALSHGQIFAGCVRRFHAEAFLLPPVVFVGLLGALWVWKCTMMVLFQNKIIYMPGLPPNARKQTIEEYAGQCGGVQWEERRIRATDGTDLALCIATVSSSGGHELVSGDQSGAEVPVYILYFQGPVLVSVFFGLRIFLSELTIERL
jgi:uncharacterized protein